MAEQQQTGKQRAARIPLDYFKQPDRLQRVKLWLTGLAVLAALGWWASNLVRSGHGDTLYSRGPVASVHQTWDADCAACHVSFQPIGDKVGVSQWLGHAGDQRCETCHAGPPHSQRQIASEVGACADCHREHRGVDASLVRLPDSDCTRCHADLPKHVQRSVQAGAAPTKKEPDLLAQYGNVSRFDLQGHPEFKAVRDKVDPGHLKFNHQVHLTPGQNKPYTLADISDPAERERYRAMQPADQRDPKSPVVLTCSSCHVLDSGDSTATRALLAGLPGDALLPPRAAGAYMLPITYENQCKACHPLTVEKAKDKTPALSVPHRLQPDALYQFLQDAYVGRYIANNPILLETPFVPPRTLPGKAPVETKPTPEQEKAAAAIGQQVVTAEKILYLGKQTCGECHDYETVGNLANLPVFPKPDDFKPNQPPQFRIQRPAVPTVWFTHAKFNHASHRALDCRECHAAAYPDSPNASTRASDVLIPGISNCLQCHAPQRHEGGKVVGGARFDCTECHSYHHGDAALQGLGAAALAPRDKLTVQQFLSGKGANGKARKP
jgi:hypothetical protein